MPREMSNLLRFASGFKDSFQIQIHVYNYHSTALYRYTLPYCKRSIRPTTTCIYEYNQKIISFTILYSAKTLNKVFCMNTNDIIRTYININFVIVAYMGIIDATER